MQLGTIGLGRMGANIARRAGEKGERPAAVTEAS
jgi:6-phosphogluconate dehydrogenase (decarboxylating)